MENNYIRQCNSWVIAFHRLLTKMVECVGLTTIAPKKNKYN